MPIALQVLALALGEIAATSWAVMSAGWLDRGPAAVLLVGLTAVAAAGFLVWASAGRIAASVFAPVLGLAVIVPLTARAMGPDGGHSFAHVLMRWVDAVFGGLLATNDEWAFLVGLCSAMWAVGFWLGWYALRERRGVLAVLPCFMVLGPNAVNGPSSDQVGLPGAFALACAVLLIAQCRLLDLTVAWRGRRTTVLPGLERRYTRVSVIAALLIVLVGGALPAVSSRDYTTSLLAAIGRGTPRGGVRSPSGGRAEPVAYSPFTKPGGALTLDPKPMLSYTVLGGGSTYLQVAVDSAFVDGNWFPSDPSMFGTASGYTEGEYRRAAAGTPFDRDPSGVAGAATVRQVTIDVRQTADATGGGALVIFPGEPVQVNRVAGPVLGYRSASSGSHALTINSVGIGDTATPIGAVGTVSTASAADLERAGTAYPRWAVDLFTRTDADRAMLDPVGAVLRRWVAGAAATPYDQAVAIETHLRSDFRYTLMPPAAPPGVWPIVDFLTNTHQGYCQYFASTMGLMLRLAGIPARLVTGYGPGASVTGPDGGQVNQVTTSDAHVWVQAYFPGFGWVNFEPTPPSDAGDYEPFSRGSTPTGRPPLVTPTPRPGPRPGPTPRATPVPEATAGPSPQGPGSVPAAFVTAVLALGGVLAIIAGLLAWLARPRTLDGMWRRLRLGSWLFGPPRRRAETHAEYVRRLAALLPSDTTTLLHRDGSGPPGPRPVRARVVEALRLMADASGREAFGPHPPQPREVIAWQRAWRRLVGMWPLLMWRRLIERQV